MNFYLWLLLLPLVLATSPTVSPTKSPGINFTPAPTQPIRNVLFVSNRTTDGNIGTRAQANHICTLEAAEFFNSNLGFAIISFFRDAVIDMPENYTGFLDNVTVVNAQATTLADNFTDLIRNYVTRIGNLVRNGEDVWTGSNPDGTYVAIDCNNWRSGGCDNGLVNFQLKAKGCSLQKRILCLAINGTA